MTPNKIQYELKERGITQKQIAEQIGVSEMAVSKVINKLIVSDRVMRAVCEKLDKDCRIVFHEYYQAPAKRKTSKVAASL